MIHALFGIGPQPDNSQSFGVDGCAEKIAELLAIIECLQATIESTQNFCIARINESNIVMSTNQPRGTWTYARAAKETAEQVLICLANDC